MLIETRPEPTYGDMHNRRKFAFFPVLLNSGQIIWWESYEATYFYLGLYEQRSWVCVNRRRLV